MYRQLLPSAFSTHSRTLPDQQLESLEYRRLAPRHSRLLVGHCNETTPLPIFPSFFPVKQTPYVLPLFSCDLLSITKSRVSSLIPGPSCQPHPQPPLQPHYWPYTLEHSRTFKNPLEPSKRFPTQMAHSAFFSHSMTYSRD